MRARTQNTALGVATVLSAKCSPLRDVDRGSSKYFFIADNWAVKDGNRLASKRRTSLFRLMHVAAGVAEFAGCSGRLSAA